MGKGYAALTSVEPPQSLERDATSVAPVIAPEGGQVHTAQSLLS
jgi:hypothetical protein